MSADFFENQEVAKRHTGRLVFLFALGVIGTVVSVWLLVGLSLGRGNLANPGLAAASVLGALAVIGVGMAAKFAQMAGGGRAVAEALGGRQIDPASRDPDERRALNIVEEMAIASGVPVPPVYVLEDDTINAFAAGPTPQSAVVGLTRGCIQRLTRDELQGVVAHEFSHIFHQDSRLNMRLVAWLGGIFAISLIGRFMLRSMHYSGGSRSKNGGAAFGLIGLGLFLIGIIGYFFGRLIQAAVSRQREFLADASAVQYTRNPAGITSALEKLQTYGSRLSAPAATEYSHFFFGEGVMSLFATHPPLQERIRRLREIGRLPATFERPAMAPPAPGRGATGAGADADAGAGTDARAAEPPVHAGASAFAGAAAATTAAAAARAGLPAGADARDVSATEILRARRQSGALTPESLEYAQELLQRTPAALVDAAREPFSARAVVCALLLSPDAAVMQRQLDAMQAAEPALRATVAALAPAVAQTRANQRLPLLQLAAASLALLSPAQYGRFRTLLAQVMAADREIDRVEWVARVLLRRVVEGRGAAGSGVARRASARDLAVVISVLAWSGARSGDQAQQAWEAACERLPELPPAPLPAPACTLDALDEALQALDATPTGRKRALVDAAIACVASDGRTTVEEAELLRAVCDSIGIPMPPIRPAE
ncbi:MAG: M48 family metallopeptidase [Phycisphaerales bacterium]